MLTCWRADNVEFLKFEVNLIYSRRTVRSDTMNAASYLQHSSNCCDSYEASLSALGYYPQQVRRSFASLSPQHSHMMQRIDR